VTAFAVLGALFGAPHVLPAFGSVRTRRDKAMAATSMFLFSGVVLHPRAQQAFLPVMPPLPRLMPRLDWRPARLATS
jgi:hypothetical protein